MAEILIKARDALQPDPIRDQAGSYKRGMPVAARADGHPWDTGETLPDFVLLKLPGVSVARVDQFLEPIADAAGNTIRRRLWQIAWADLPVGARNKLATTGSITIGQGGDYTWAQFRAFLKRFDTGASAPASL